MGDFIKRFGLLLLGVLVLGTLVAEGSLYFLRQSTFYKPSFVSNGLQGSSYDYVVLGSSIGLTTLNTQVIDSLAGLQGVNLSMDDTGIGSQYVMLQHFLAEGNTTNYVVLSNSLVGLKTIDPEMSVNDYRFLPFMRRDYVRSYLEEQETREGQLLSISQYFSLVGVAYYNSEVFYPSLISIFEPQRRNRFDAYGNYSYPKNEYQESKLLSFKNVHLIVQNPYFKRLKELCASQGIELVVYLAPMAGTRVVTDAESFLIVNHSALFTDSAYFYDPVHVNALGRERASEAFADEWMSRCADE